jgi:hypothetical protein
VHGPCSEVVEKFPHLRPEILAKLLQSFGELRLAKIMRGALWVLGEYATDQQGELARPTATVWGPRAPTADCGVH